MNESVPLIVATPTGRSSLLREPWWTKDTSSIILAKRSAYRTYRSSATTSARHDFARACYYLTKHIRSAKFNFESRLIDNVPSNRRLSTRTLRGPSNPRTHCLWLKLWRALSSRILRRLIVGALNEFFQSVFVREPHMEAMYLGNSTAWSIRLPPRVVWLYLPRISGYLTFRFDVI